MSRMYDYRNVTDDPVSCLNQAKDLYDLGRTEQSLSTLVDFVQQRRYRGWSEDIDNLISFHLMLSFKMKDVQSLRNAVLHFKNICQQAHVESLMSVIEIFLDFAEQEIAQTDLSRSQNQDLAEKSIEHLRLISLDWADLSSTCRVIIANVRFIYLAYFSILEIFSNDLRMLNIYHRLAHRALWFCLKYDRKRELRRICSAIHSHIKRRKTQGGQSETKEMLQDTFIEILNCAEKLGISQEALKSAEEINKLNPTGRLRVIYYKALTKIFQWGAHNFNAYVHVEMFRIQKKTLSQVQLTELASQVMCAVMSVPPWSCEWDIANLDSSVREKQKILYSLLPDCKFNSKSEDIDKMLPIECGGSTSLFSEVIQLPPKFTHHVDFSPTREDVVKLATIENIDDVVFPELRWMYADMEEFVSPREFLRRLTPRLDFIKETLVLSSFHDHVLEASIAQYIVKISRMYDSVKIEYLSPFVEYMQSGRFQRLLTKISTRMNNIISVDLASNSVRFSDPRQNCGSEKGQYLSYMAVVLNKVSSSVCESAYESRESAYDRFIKEEESERISMENRMILLREMADTKNKELEKAPQPEKIISKKVKFEMPKKILRETNLIVEETQTIDGSIKKKIKLANVKEKINNLKASKLAPKLVQLLNSGKVNLDTIELSWINAQVAEEVREESQSICKRQAELDLGIRYYAHIVRVEENIHRHMLPGFYDEGLASSVSSMMEAKNNSVREHKDRLSKIEGHCPQFVEYVTEMRNGRLKAELLVFEEARELARNNALEKRKSARKNERRREWISQKPCQEKLSKAVGEANKSWMDSHFKRDGEIKRRGFDYNKVDNSELNSSFGGFRRGSSNL